MSESDSARGRLLDQLRDVREILQAMELLPGAMFMIKDLDSRYVWMSGALKEAIHLPRDFKIEGKSDFDLFPPTIAAAFRENDLEVLQKGRTLVREVHATGFHGNPSRWVYSSKFPLHDRQGKVIGLITLNEEYSDEKGFGMELERLLPAIDWVRANFSKGIRVSDLAKRCGFSTSHFSRVFKKHLKMSPHDFLERVRLSHAIDGLRRSARGIAEIAFDCGLYDPSAFVKWFKRLTGSTPQQFRRQQRQQNDRSAFVV